MLERRTVGSKDRAVRDGRANPSRQPLANARRRALGLTKEPAGRVAPRQLLRRRPYTIVDPELDRARVGDPEGDLKARMAPPDRAS